MAKFQRRDWGGYARHILRATGAAAWLAAAPAYACPVCITLPEDTMADLLLGARTVALARENPDRPYSYHVTEIIEGPPADTEIPFLVNASMRRRLAANPDDAVLVALSPGGDWAMLGYAKSEMRAVAADVLNRSEDWSGPSGDAARFEFFASLLDSPDRTLQRQALTEIARMPYALIRTVSTAPPPDRIRGHLGDVNMLAYRPLLILLLALSPRPEDAAWIVAAFDRSGTGSNDLAALATAVIELGGAEGLDRVTNKFLARRGTPPEATKSAITALGAIGRGGDPALRPMVATTLYRLIDERPDLAASAATELASWSDYSQAEIVAGLIGTGLILAPDDLFALNNYVFGAERAARGAGN